MDLLPLEVIGWLFTVGCTVALLAGAWLTIGLQRSGEEGRRALAVRLLEDLILFSLWLLGLAGGIGVLTGKGWSRPALELFCWTITILLVLSAARRFRAAPSPRWVLGLSLAAFVAPIIVVCVATVLTLRSEAALKQLSAIQRILPA
jgi:hypothetical protein